MKWHIGTSGWTYKEWDDFFYPRGFKGPRRIRYYSRQFNATEVNASFYHTLRDTVYKKWHSEVNRDFRFAVKMHRYITQVRRLTPDDQMQDSLNRFFQNVSFLNVNLGPVLIQLPPSLKADKQKLDGFLKMLPEGYRFAMEFRDDSWFGDEVKEILQKHNCARVISQSSKWPVITGASADFLYARFHGPGKLFESYYSNEALESWAKQLLLDARNAKEAFVFFNNTAEDYAINNARKMQQLLHS